MKPTLAPRRARVRRIQAKRPPHLRIRATPVPSLSTIDELAARVLDLLDDRRRSGRK